MAININLGRIRNAVGTTSNYELTVEKLAISEEVAITKPVQISAMVTNNGPILELKGYIRTEITGKCSRCLEKVVIPVNAVIEEELVHVADLRYLGDFTEDELAEKFLIFDHDLFDLTDLIRENIIFSLPYKILCKEKCRGLCIKCGQNLNEKECGCDTEEIDPRLAILAKLKGIEEV
ncbi:MAG: YceD family protein [Peptococcaceae bacterium]